MEPAYRPPYEERAVLSRLHFLLAAIFGPDVLLQAPVAVAGAQGEVLEAGLVLLDAPPRPETRVFEAPRLVFEVPAPDLGEVARERRSRAWLRAGVREAWMLDVARAEIAVHDAGGVRVGKGDSPIHSHAFPAIALVPRRLFAPPRAW